MMCFLGLSSYIPLSPRLPPPPYLLAIITHNIKYIILFILALFERLECALFRGKEGELRSF